MTVPEVDFEPETWRMMLVREGPSAGLPVTETRAVLDADPAGQAGLSTSEIAGFGCPRGTLG
jgi:hypothetical protein